MSFTTFSFLLFITLIFFLYYLFPLRRRWLVLLGGSLWFYWVSGGRLILWLLLTSATVWAGALRMQKLADESALRLKEIGDREKRGEEQRAVRKKKHRTAAAVLVLNFALLALTKYMPLFQSLADLLSALAGGERVSLPQIAMPLGISFYTFQAAGYVIDVYRG